MTYFFTEYKFIENIIVQGKIQNIRKKISLILLIYFFFRH